MHLAIWSEPIGANAAGHRPNWQNAGDLHENMLQKLSAAFASWKKRTRVRGWPTFWGSPEHLLILSGKKTYATSSSQTTNPGQDALIQAILEPAETNIKLAHLKWHGNETVY
nr:hypothetical protein [Dictyobacter alpinus]